MKIFVLLLALATSVDSAAPSESTGATTSPVPVANPALPTAGFPASRYEALWTKSPFAVATSEDATETSPDYMLVGLANIDGVSYASVIDRQSQEHFLISSDKATRGLTLTSITRSHDSSDTFASVQKDGQLITLKLEQAPTGPPLPGVGGNQPGMGGALPIMTPQITMPGTGTYSGAVSVRPFPRFHRSLIHLPPPPGQSQQPQSVQVHPTPPPSQ